MEPDDLLCSRNARSRTPLVGRAQWKINQATLYGDRRASSVGPLEERHWGFIQASRMARSLSDNISSIF